MKTKLKGRKTLSCLIAGIIAGSLPLAAAADEPSSANGVLGRTLFGENFTKDTGLQLGGWIEAGFVLNKDNGRQVGLGNSPIVLARDSGLQLNQAYLYLEKGINTNVIPRVTPTPAPMSQEYSIGFYVDTLYGRDGQPMQTYGWDDDLNINSPGNDTPATAATTRQNFLIQPQAYLQAYMPWGLGMSMIAGNWMSPVGYEIGFHPQPGPNIFYSHTYAFAAAPIKHTGVLVAANLMKNSMGLMSGEFGVVNGWSNFKDNNDALAYIAALRYRTPDMATWVDYEFMTGASQADSSRNQGDVARNVNIPVTRLIAADDQNKTQHALTISKHFTPNWYGLVQFTYGQQKGDGAASTIDIVTGPGFDGASWSAAEVQVQYKLSPTLSVAGRVEKFRDPDGFALFPNTVAVKSDYTDATLGLQWWAFNNLLVRPEIRHDSQSNNNGVNAFRGGVDSSSTTMSVDAVFYF